MKKILAAIAAAVILISLTSGCFQISVEELYALPKLSEEYVDLQSQLDFVLSQGSEYSPPRGGENRQAVQLVDLNGDGHEEVVAFFSATSGASLRAYVYSPAEEDGAFAVADIIEGVGTGFESVRFADMNNDGVLEIIIGWQMSEALRHMTLYMSQDLKHTAVAESDYSAMITGDVTGEGATDILLTRAATQTVRGEAEIIFLMGAMVARMTAPLSGGVNSVEHMVIGKLKSGETALYSDGILSRGRYVTDVFALVDGVFANVTLTVGGTSSATVRYPYPAQEFAKDMSSPKDGVIEVPVSVRLPLYTGASIPYYALDWFVFDINGAAERVISTLHDYQNGWYLVMPEDWHNRITVRRDNNPYVSGERVMVFSFYKDSQFYDFLRVYTLTGDTREDRARLKNRFRLYDDGVTVYAAELLNPGDQFTSLPTEESVRTNFGKITTEWF